MSICASDYTSQAINNPSQLGECSSIVIKVFLASAQRKYYSTLFFNINKVCPVPEVKSDYILFIIH